MSLESVIRLDRISKSYGDHLALDLLSLDVPPGSVFGLLIEMDCTVPWIYETTGKPGMARSVYPFPLSY